MDTIHALTYTLYNAEGTHPLVARGSKRSPCTQQGQAEVRKNLVHGGARPREAPCHLLQGHMTEKSNQRETRIASRINTDCVASKSNH